MSERLDESGSESERESVCVQHTIQVVKISRLHAKPCPIMLLCYYARYYARKM